MTRDSVPPLRRGLSRSLGGLVLTRRRFLRAAAASALLALAAGPLTTAAKAAGRGAVAARAAASAATPPRVIVVGFDGMDPVLLRQELAAGTLPNFARLLDRGELHELGTSIPPQSPVAWSNFITGMNAGGHGIFDFIHRDPRTLIPYLSTSEAKPPTKYLRLGQWKLPREEARVELLRDGTAFWELLADAGVDVTIYKIPANFPPVECEARSLSGMGTPDILGTYGIFTYVTDDPPANMEPAGGQVVVVDASSGRFEIEIPGPTNTLREGDPPTSATLAVVVDPENAAASVTVGDETVLLQEGEWSDWVSLRFPLAPWLRFVPGMSGSAEARGICRLHLMEARPSFRLYITPVQIDPREPAMPISTPPQYAAELAAATGLYYTQGLPEDTKALDAGVLDDDDYVQMATIIYQEHMAALRHELARFAKLDSGFLFFYFNSPDQNCHMFWRAMDPDSPVHAEAAAHADRIHDVYVSLDAALGEILQAVDERTVLMVMSDHGFAPYRRSFHVNRWLLENGYLAVLPGVDPTDVEYLAGVDWSRTRAYALGINSVYLNLRGREQNGIVGQGHEQETLLAELAAKLEQVVDPATGQRAVKYAYRGGRVYQGPHAAQAPDIVMGYYRGFRGSDESALGEIPADVFADNLRKWSGDHCMAADEVPGILATNRPLAAADPSLVDMAPTILRLFGLTPPAEMIGRDLLGGS